MMVLIFIRGLLLGTALFLSMTASAQSFSCNDAAKLKGAEQTVCKDTDLSFLDRKLNYFFQRAMDTSPAPKQVKTDQLHWLAQMRNPCATDKKCLNTAYQARIDKLSSEILTALSKKNPKPFPVRFDHTIDTHTDDIDPNLNSQNACMKLFLKQSIPSYESNVSDYHFTKDSLDEIPVNVGMFGYYATSKQIALAVLQGKSGKQFSPKVKFTYLSPHEIRFIDGKGINAFETRLKILAWGDFNHDGMEDILIHEDYRFTLNKKMTEWGRWNSAASTTYMILTKNKNERLFRTVYFYLYDIPTRGYQDKDTYGKVCIPSTDYYFTLKDLTGMFINIPTLYMKFIS